ncbi:hypothetical protein [Streptacidiphilus jiangxiensis]|uniref:PEP-CTERM protein-sorting domain-containing protein n=1 Tax=Streptacidiphilus jiangxiensis TaxID=235985 RepID=A0A1H7XPL1_STRJI|nr:hypothetical protein [Streptacidiphilus jiangxiensis]SEM34929.1 PEP-CTERM protein-sorting domain-containing protein [Streptacidiphilus jiangxiensis]
MSLTDWLIDLALIGLVVLQLRGRRLTLRTLLLPVALVGWAGVQYLHAIPTGGGDLELIVPATLLGLALGVGAGVLSRVHRTAEGAVVVRATIAAAVLWVVGVGCRLAFQVYATHGGGPAIGRFSVEHHLDPGAWTAAILLMAFGEVIARTAIVGWRALGTRRQPTGPRVLSA